jgi:hypothetical protein
VSETWFTGVGVRHSDGTEYELTKGGRVHGRGHQAFHDETMREFAGGTIVQFYVLRGDAVKAIVRVDADNAYLHCLAQEIAPLVELTLKRA